MTFWDIYWKYFSTDTAADFSGFILINLGVVTFWVIILAYGISRSGKK